MQWPRPTQNFEHMIAEAFGGQVWTSTRDLSYQLLYSWTDLVSQIYSFCTPGRRKNDIGEQFDVEMHFINGELSPNAFAFHNSKTYCIAISTTLFTLIETVAHHIVSSDQFFDILYERDKQSLEESMNLMTRDILDEAKLRTIGFVGCDITEDLIDIDGRYIININRFNNLTDHQKHDACFLRNIILEYVFHHEMGHIISGHVGFARSRLGIMAICEATQKSCSQNLEQSRRLMEFQADHFAAKQMFRTSTAHVISSKRTPYPKTLEIVATYQLLAIEITQTIFSTLDIILNRGAVDGDWTLSMVDSMLKEGAYPSGGVRILSGQIAFIESLQFVSKQEIEGFNWELYEIINRRFLTLKGYIGRTFTEFASIGVFLKEYADGVFPNMSLYDDLSALDSQCKPYAFYD